MMLYAEMLYPSVPEGDIRYLRRQIVAWGKSNFSSFPWRKTTNGWHALVAEIMLQRTRAEQVLPVYKSFCKSYESPVKFLMVKQPGVFASLGLGWREEQLRKLAEILSYRQIPDNKRELLRLPGIGDYVASAYLSLHLRIRETIVDSNVVRLYGRFFGFRTDAETRRQKWFLEFAKRVTPPRSFWQFNYGVIDLTRIVCKRSPICSMCTLKSRCRYYAEDGTRSYRGQIGSKG